MTRDELKDLMVKCGIEELAARRKLNNMSLEEKLLFGGKAPDDSDTTDLFHRIANTMNERWGSGGVYEKEGKFLPDSDEPIYPKDE